MRHWSSFGRTIQTHRLVLLALCILTFALWLGSSLHVLDITSFGGWGPSDYIYEKFFPENFTKNFLGNHIERLYDNSIGMAPAIVAYKMGIDQDMYTYLHMLLQALAIVAALYCLALALFHKPWIALCAIMPVLVSSWAGVNFARFGSLWDVLAMPFYYVFAWASGLAALAFFLRNSWFMMFVFLALCTYCHVIMGVFFCAFVGAWLLFNPRRWLNFSFLAGLTAFALAVVPHVLSLAGTQTETLGIPFEEWMKIALLSSYHWFPSYLGVLFGQLFFESGLPTLLLMGVMPLTLFFLPGPEEYRNKLLAGWAALCLVTFGGLLMVEIFPNITFIRLSLQRASAVLTLLSMLLLVGVLLQVCSAKKSLYVPAALLLFYGIYAQYLEALYAVILFLLIGIGIQRLTSLTHPVSALRQANEWCVQIFEKLPEAARRGGVPALCGVVFVFTLCTVWNLAQSKMPPERLETARNFRAAQLWARDNTPIDSLFMTDPAHSYAWRDGSARSHFGSGRDWIFIPIVYFNDVPRYQEGKRRLREFGPDLDAITLNDVKNAEFSIRMPYKEWLDIPAQEAYYTMEPERILELAVKYGITHMVQEKQRSKNIVQLRDAFPCVYENAGYAILYIAPSQAR